jgi:hypothetical protein
MSRRTMPAVTTTATTIPAVTTTATTIPAVTIDGWYIA